jgi:hypothetical protein
LPTEARNLADLPHSPDASKASASLDRGAKEIPATSL